MFCRRKVMRNGLLIVSCRLRLVAATVYIAVSLVMSSGRLIASCQVISLQPPQLHLQERKLQDGEAEVAEPPAAAAVVDAPPPDDEAGDGSGGGDTGAASTAASSLRAMPDFLPVKLPAFPWWALPILPSQAALPWSDPHAGPPHLPILDNLFLLLKVAESCFNCTFFLSVDTPLLLDAYIGRSANPRNISPANLRLLYYQVVPFRLTFSGLAPLPLAFRIPSYLNGSYLLVTRSASSFPRDNFVSLNYQRVLAPDLLLADSMVVHGISGFLAPFTLSIPF